MNVKEVEKKYLYVNKECGRMVGIWPYQSELTKRIGRASVILISISSIVTQVARITHFFAVDILIEQCPFLAMAIGILFKEGNYIINEKKLRVLLNYLFEDWAADRPKVEQDIMDTHARRGAFFSILYVANGIFCYVIFSLVAIVPRILRDMYPKNDSHGGTLIYPAYYGVDEEEHYYVLISHTFAVITIVFFVYISCDTIYMNLVQHACALFIIAGYRFQSAVDESSIYTTYRKVRNSIKGHQHAITFIGEMGQVHETYYFFLVALVIISFSVTLVKASSMDPSVEFYKYCGFLVVQLVHLLFICIQGQFFINCTDEVYNAIYSGLWYRATPKMQLMYAIALRRSLTPPMLTAGGLMTLNLESFSEIIKASVSYFTVLKSS